MLLLLRSLEPRFIRCDVGIADDDHGRPTGENDTIQWGGFPIDVISRVQTLADADGIQFLCPKCYFQNGGPVGTHTVAVYFRGRGAPPHIGKDSNGQPARWDVMGNDFLDLTLAPSIWIKSGCGWHGYIEHGAVRDV